MWTTNYNYFGLGVLEVLCIRMYIYNYILYGCSVDLRKHDVAFLITLRPTVPIHHKYNFREPFIPQVGLTYVRGCEVEGMLDMEGKVIEDGKDQK